MAKWDDLPPELVAEILEMRGEAMMDDKQKREVDKVVASFWQAVWRAKKCIHITRTLMYHRCYVPAGA